MKNPKIKALLLAAGLGTRLCPLTDKLPKCLIPFNNKPLLDFWLDSIEETGIQEVLINTHRHRRLVQEYLDTRRKNNFVIHEAFEPHLLGSAGTISANLDWISTSDYCVIVYADNFSDVDLKNVILDHITSNSEITMLLFEAPDPTQCGIVELDDEGFIKQFQEKPKNPTTNLANGGVYVMSANIINEIEKMNAFDLGHDVFPRLIGKIRGFIHQGYHRDIGTFESLSKIESELNIRVTL